MVATEPREAEMENKKMVSLRLLLSCGGDKGEKKNWKRKSSSDLFECKTCNRKFSTFQALGGHCMSHKRTRVGGARMERMKTKPKLLKVHGCPVCGLEFPMGQALGGHMRRHKPPPEKKDVGGKVLLLDLNLPPLEEGELFQNQGLGLGFLKEDNMIDFLGCSTTRE